MPENEERTLPQPLAVGRTAEIYPWTPGKILKLYRPGWSESDTIFEANLTRQANTTGFVAPEVFEQVNINGRFGFIMEHVKGTAFSQSFIKQPWKAADFSRQMGKLHAKMHSFTASGLPPQKKRLENKIKAVTGAPLEMQQAALTALSALPEGDRLCHGDFHPDNVIRHGTDFCVIDWLDASVGHPLADVARTILLMRVGELPNKLLLRLIVTLIRKTYLANYTRAYFEQSPHTQAELEPFMLPVAFARLSEDIQPERARLVEFIRQHLPG